MGTEPVPDQRIPVQVVYALPGYQAIVALDVPEGATASEAVTLSGLLDRFPEIGAAPEACAVYGRLVPPSHVLAAQDRVEILRPLLIDPKENRRQVAARNQAATRRQTVTTCRSQ
ncbi:hypothetical protein ACG33_06770 [Steroidobacter denitrificans]|uniref:UPF0125 protein ACG33_06770 n=1 Tax=Steroidobacter denitrificans TaxID=465721 RepID=A0A127FB33_STEDE|nr:RnfH family protein [Steroidobacter denitrificans]AMN46805.1 hypothetical protein ACG33_06770 [Steroidobacter denitrificans]